jgi:hypothetical protein
MKKAGSKQCRLSVLVLSTHSCSGLRRMLHRSEYLITLEPVSPVILHCTATHQYRVWPSVQCCAKTPPSYQPRDRGQTFMVLADTPSDTGRSTISEIASRDSYRGHASSGQPATKGQPRLDSKLSIQTWRSQGDQNSRFSLRISKYSEFISCYC